MINHPDFFNLRKVATILAAGPIGLLLLLILLDFSWHHVNKLWQASAADCNRTIQGGAPLYGENDCQPTVRSLSELSQPNSAPIP